MFDWTHIYYYKTSAKMSSHWKFLGLNQHGPSWMTYSYAFIFACCGFTEPLSINTIDMVSV